MTTQPEALSLAEVFEEYALDHQPDGWPAIQQEVLNSAAAELRRLHAENEELRKALDLLTAFVPDGACPACGSDCNERDELIKAEREIERLNEALRAALEQPVQEPVASEYKQELGSKNCMQCATAYMLGLSLDAVPDFERSGPDAWEAFYAFFADRGFTAEMFPSTVEIDGDYLASGDTDRGTSHMVVMRGGELLHDPHPSNTGLKSVQAVWLIARKAGLCAAPQPAQQPDTRTTAIQSCINRLIQGGKPAEAGILRHHFAKDLGGA